MKRNVFCARCNTLETCHWTQFCFAILSSEQRRAGRRKRKRLCDTVQPEAMVNRASSPSHSSRMKNERGTYWSEWLVITDERGGRSFSLHLRKYCGNSSDRNGGRKAWSTVDFSSRITRNSLVTVCLFTRGAHANRTVSFFSGEHASTVDKARLIKVIRVKQWFASFFFFPITRDWQAYSWRN